MSVNQQQTQRNQIIQKVKRYQQMGRMEKAVEAIEEMPDQSNPENLKACIRLYAELGEYEKARTANERLKGQAKESITAQAYEAAIQSHQCLHEQHYEKAKVLAVQAHKSEPEDYFIGTTYIRSCLGLQEAGEDVAATIETCKRLEPSEEIVRLELMYYEQTGDEAMCRRILRREKMLHPNSELVDYGEQILQRMKRREAITKTDSSDCGMDEQAMEAAMNQLNKMVGLRSVKEEIERYRSQLLYEKLRGQVVQGLREGQERKRYNFIFAGNPGTGKTTVARLFGEIFRALGILTKGHVVEVSRESLCSGYVGQTAIQTQKKIEEAVGGVLFVDEAYTLMNRGENDFGQEAMDTIMKGIEDHRGELVTIFAGYRNPLNQLMEMNPGIRSRFNHFILFEDYTREELLQIAEGIMKKKKYFFTSEGRRAFLERIEEKKLDETFGNAREVEVLIEHAIAKKAEMTDLSKISGMSEYDLGCITAAHFGVDYSVSVEEKVAKSLEQLDGLIGLDSVKRVVNEMVGLIRYRSEEAERGRVVRLPSLHMVFTGNPGTGKTTVAQIMAEILKDLGILKRGQLVTASREDLVAGYVGQTAIKTAAKIKEALGGVLFIDEAYALAQGGENDFGQEAIDVLIKQMEDQRDKLVVILAGYSEDMEHLLNANSGFRSRIGNIICFEDYTAQEMLRIFQLYAHKEGYLLSKETELQLQQVFEQWYQNRSKNFGNAREVRKLYEHMIHLLAGRVAGSSLTGKERYEFLPQDIPQQN